MSEFDTNLDAKTADTLDETDKKCPSCGGVMDYDPATGGLACPYCGHTETIAKTQDEAQAAEELSLADAENIENCNWGAEKKTVICKACGAETIYDALEISGTCPFCGSNQVMEASDKTTMAPGGVVPFKVTDEKASELFKNWIGKKWFCPKLAKESAKAKSFKGVYLPYWTFDAQSESTYTAAYGKDRRIKAKDGNDKIITDWYQTKGTYQEDFDDELICGTVNHDSGMLSQITPFDTADNKVYKPEYVAGFAAERYSRGIKDAFEMAKSIFKMKIESGIRSKVQMENHADHVKNIYVTTKYSGLTYKYLMLPVWMSSYKYKDKVYQFMVNGQTGKVAGKIPISIPKVIFTVAAAVLAAALIYYLLS